MSDKIALFILLALATVYVQSYTDDFRCDYPIPLVAHVAFQNRGKTGLTLKGTTARMSLTLGQTACFSLSIRNSSDQSSLLEAEFRKRILYAFRLEEVRNEYPVQNSYTFTQADLKVSCLCDCPGGADRCAPEYENSDCDNSEDSAACYTFYQRTSSAGCFLSIFDSTAEICCKAWIMPHMENGIYVALQLGTPSTKLRVRKMALNEKGEPVGPSDVLETDSKEGRFSSDSFEVELTSTVQKEFLRPGMYFVNSAGDLYQPSHVSLNYPGTYEMERLGWLKHQNKWYIPAKSTVKAKLEIRTQSCAEENFDMVHSYTTDKPEDVSSRVIDLYSGKIQKMFYNRKERRVEEILSAVHRMDFLFHIQEDVDVLFHYQPSTLYDFNAEILLDRYSNEFLNITLKGVSGTVLGWVRHESQKFAFSIISKSLEPTMTTVYKPTSFCANNTQICLRPVSTKQPICKIISCRKESLEGVIREDGTFIEVGELEEEAWSEKVFSVLWDLLNPKNWFESWTGLAAVVFYAIIAIFTLMVVTQLCVCVNSVAKLSRNCTRQTNDETITRHVTSCKCDQSKSLQDSTVI
ncbi:cell fusion protein aff-1-like [Limulus polyphemus]|uniref:Cell fusion protein aff-1-like n=1 Tax=Limulus polyphemus TaxID=6850 RepID=A0ABM1B089_LIMPO|nr:cell fusion protein aff-1-like [Limulus polyphemus]